MATEPQRDIEKDLAAYASKRREEAGAPPPLHPATRKLLQGEAARVWSAKKSAPGFWAALLAGGWPRLAIGLSTILVLGLAAVVFLPPRKHGESTLAMNSLKAPDDSRRQAESAAKPAADLPARKLDLDTKKELPADKQKQSASFSLELNGTGIACKTGWIPQ